MTTVLWQPIEEILNTVGEIIYYRSPKFPHSCSVINLVQVATTLNGRGGEGKSWKKGFRSGHLREIYIQIYFLCPTSSSSIMALRLTVMFLLLVVLSLPGLIHSFQPLFSFDGSSITHRDITQRAVLRKTAEVCRDIAVSEGRDFSLTVSWKAAQKLRKCATVLHSDIYDMFCINNIFYQRKTFEVKSDD